MPNNLSAYSFVNDANLCNTGVCFDIDEAALTSGVLYPQTGQVRDGGYSPPPVSITYTPVEIDGEDSLSLDNYLSEGSTVSVNLTSTTTCVNLATGYDAFNFGYQLLIRERGLVLDRTDNFTYENNTFNITGSGNLISNWTVLSSTARYNKMLSGTGIDRLPVGSYKRTTSPNDVITLNYYLPIEFTSSYVFWLSSESINVYKTKKIVWDMSSIRLGGEDLKNQYIPINRGETVFIAAEGKKAFDLSLDYLVIEREFPEELSGPYPSGSFPPYNYYYAGTNSVDTFDYLTTFEEDYSGFTYFAPLSNPVGGNCTRGGTSKYINGTYDATLINVKALKSVYSNSDYILNLGNRWEIDYSQYRAPQSIPRVDTNINLRVKGYYTGTMVNSSFYNDYGLTTDSYVNLSGGIKLFDYRYSNLDVPLQQYFNYPYSDWVCFGYKMVNGINTYYDSRFHYCGVLTFNVKNWAISFTPISNESLFFFIGSGPSPIFSLSSSYVPADITPASTTSLSALTPSPYSSSLLWSDGVITQSEYDYPFYLPDNTIGYSTGGSILSRTFNVSGEYTLISNTRTYNISGAIYQEEEPYNITFVVN
jgi:hypothetical protein